MAVNWAMGSHEALDESDGLANVAAPLLLVGVRPALAGETGGGG